MDRALAPVLEQCPDAVDVGRAAGDIARVLVRDGADEREGVGEAHELAPVGDPGRAVGAALELHVVGAAPGVAAEDRATHLRHAVELGGPPVVGQPPRDLRPAGFHEVGREVGPVVRAIDPRAGALEHVERALMVEPHADLVEDAERRTVDLGQLDRRENAQCRRGHETILPGLQESMQGLD